jgi:hypothetical protein
LRAKQDKTPIPIRKLLLVVVVAAVEGGGRLGVEAAAVKSESSTYLVAVDELRWSSLSIGFALHD